MAVSRNAVVAGALGFVAGAAVMLALVALKPRPEPRGTIRVPAAGDGVVERENAALRERIRELESRPAPPSVERPPQIGPDASARLEPVALWLRGLSPRRFGDLTAEELRHLRDLDLSDLPITDGDLARLEGLEGLRSLDLRGTRVTDAGMAHVGKLAGLRRLVLWGTEVTDAGLGPVGGLPKLEVLDLRVMRGVTDAGLAHLGGLSTLKELTFTATPITGSGLAHLAGLQSLESLTLQQTRVSDAELAHVGALRGLRTLNLNATAVTDAGMKHVEGLPGLTGLSLGQTKVSAEWKERYAREHPGASVR
jgi:hypothetical protein